MPSGGTSATAAFTLTNTSSTQITGLVITPAMPNAPNTPPTDFTVENTSCTATLPANGTCSINVAFTPQAGGARTGTLSVTDSDSGDSATYDLAGTGDDYSLQLASGQSEEVNVAVGGTATFMAEVAPDSVFGQNGEMVKFQCPSNLPGFATCSFSPCPVAITPGAAVAFTLTFVTSSATAPAPPVGNSCGSTGAVAPAPRDPTMILRAVPERQVVVASRQFPSPSLLALLALAILGSAAAVAGFGMRERTGLRPRRRRYAFALAGFAAALAIGCHGYKAKPLPTTPVTPTGVTSMTILGNATDASGNALGTSRSLQVTLDVVTR
ncbi:MAG: hypothetical protein ACRENC_05930 [Gemmatimonadaceae bacterium]